MSGETPVVEYTVTAASRDRIYKERSAIIVEFPLEIEVNGRPTVHLLCTPEHLEELVTGFLYNEGLITSLDELLQLKIGAGKAEVKIAGEFPDTEGGVPWLTSGCGRNIGWRGDKARNCIFEGRISSDMTVSPATVIDLMLQLQRSPELYQKTRGAHGAALADAKGLIIFREDIGRHNAIDKVAGALLHRKLETADKLLLTTGRISSEIVTKAARMGTPFLVSRSVPTDYAIQLGELLGITLVGMARGPRFKVYTHEWRLA
ncbi:formate dehydrogenase accessory sulfurtransferase FdhD [Thermanaeromonas sp. C210]|uniref:formate dehydrogenase accessory sulfurtransferase FdhD n=1 Tax=Thermanaeromonas sp. C210 TaxID=2731925 RepID=UPI00155D191E|nr:formate dehydrogenase accessory sulfurtransferase FdhD [Thermanaeromonas sp. C210]GFN23282.1 sulfurtransferase FdhD [Thermanaeromonas sp. C210]